MTTNKIGLIAGEGKMPIYITQKATAKGVEVFVAGVKGNAFAKDYPSARVFKTLRLGQLGAAIQFLSNTASPVLLWPGVYSILPFFLISCPICAGRVFWLL